MHTRSKLLYAYIIFVVLYAVSYLFPRPIATMQRYELGDLQYRLLALSVFIPLTLIWYAAFYGCYKLRRYSHTVKGTPDGRHVAKLTTGIMVLAFSLPISSIFGAVASIAIEHHTSLEGFAKIAKQYISLIFPLVGFIYISIGARGLSELAKQRPTYRAFNILALIFIAISVAYCATFFKGYSMESTHLMPQFVSLATLVVPYLFTWCLGLLSAYELHLYARGVAGSLYRRTWNTLATGLASIIILQIIVQFFSNVTAQASNLKLARLLIIVYVLLALLAAGYLLVALGAKRLQKIEEV
jgi:hypothetical protein